MAAGTKTLLECGDLHRAAGPARGPASSEDFGSRRRQLRLCAPGQLGTAESDSNVWELKVTFFSVVWARLTSGALGTRWLPSAQPGSRFPRCCQTRGWGERAPRAPAPHSVNAGSAIQRAPGRSSVMSGQCCKLGGGCSFGVAAGHRLVPMTTGGTWLLVVSTSWEPRRGAAPSAFAIVLNRPAVIAPLK